MESLKSPLLVEVEGLVPEGLTDRGSRVLWPVKVEEEEEEEDGRRL